MNVQDEHDIEDILEMMQRDDEEGEVDTSTEDDDPEETQEEVDENQPDDEVEEDPEEAPEDDDEEEEPSEGDEEPSENDEAEDDDEEEAPLADDEAEVVVTVNGEEQRVSVSELKRLAGQESALTQKAQSLASQRKAVEDQGLYVTKVLETRYNSAKERADKFKDVDLYRARQELDDTDFEALRSAKESAEAELRTIEAEANDFMEAANRNRQTLLREQAKEARKVITEAIPDWSDELYGKIRTYAVNQGMDLQVVNEVVDPGAILMMHKAMQFDAAKSKTDKVKKKVAKAPKRVAKKAQRKTDTKSSKLKALQRQAAESGSVDDIAALMQASADQ